jgi:hypothetical protein
MILEVALLLLLNLFTQTPNKKLLPFWHPLSVRAIITWTFNDFQTHRPTYPKAAGPQTTGGIRAQHSAVADGILSSPVPVVLD